MGSCIRRQVDKGLASAGSDGSTDKLELAACNSLAAAPSLQSCSSNPTQWMHKVHGVQSKRTPEAWEAAQLRIEQSRQQEVSYRKCKAATSHAVRSRALVAESLSQMACSSAPEEHVAIQARWRCAQEVSKACRSKVMKKADDALYSNRNSSQDEAREESPEARMRDADEEEDEAMAEVAQLVGAADVRSMAAVGREGLRPSDDRAQVPVPVVLEGRGGPPARRARAASPARGAQDDATTVQTLLQQLKVEPKNEAECTAKFLLYEGYAGEVEEMRTTLFKFYEESRPTVPEAVAHDMGKQVKGIDNTDAMGIPDRAREWFVYHMMRQAEKNNLHMASILDNFEKKLEFLASNDQNECPVCLECFEDGGAHAAETLSCCHKVCKDCWTNWTTVMGGRPFCPLCRHEEFLGAIVERM